MTLLEFYAELRNELLSQISNVRDSEFGIFWDDTNPNFITRHRLQEILDRHVMKSRHFGLYVVTRHFRCPNPSHEDYVLDNPYGLQITYRNQNYNWPGGQMFQGSRVCTCPCAEGNKPSEHHIIEDIIYHKDADQSVCARLERILSDVYTAMEKAADKRPRSAIRELLLRAIIQINDQILPLPMDEYIDHQLKLSGRNADLERN